MDFMDIAFKAGDTIAKISKRTADERHWERRWEFDGLTEVVCLKA